MKDYYVYFHINPVKNEIFYVGKGRKWRAYDRTQRSELWKRVYNKYGLIVDIVHQNLTNMEAIEFEKFYIKRIGRKNKGEGPLVNLTDGGDGNDGWVMKKSTRDKISIRAKERLSNPKNHPLYGTTVSDDVKRKKSISMKKWYETNDGPIKGKKKSPEQIQKSKDTIKKMGMHVLGMNSKAIKAHYEGKEYGCIKEIWLEYFQEKIDYKFFVKNRNIFLKVPYEKAEIAYNDTIQENPTRFWKKKWIDKLG